MSSKLIGIAFSDLHIHKFSKFGDEIEGVNGRLYQSVRVLSLMGTIARDLKVPIFFSGDLYDDNKEIENETGSLSLMVYKTVVEDRGIDFFAISGNHDISERNGLDRKIPTPTHLQKLKVFKTFHLLDHESKETVVTKKFTIQGVPYFDNDADTVSEIKRKGKIIKKLNPKVPKILLLHQDFPGAKTPAGFECKEYNALNTNLDKLFRHWDFVLCGHIHKPQQVAKNAWMLGSPIHQITSDEGTLMGYWEIYSNKRPKFIPLNDIFPEFKTIAANETPANEKDYYIRLPIKQTVEKDIKVNKFSLNNKKDKLASRYLAQKGIKSKSKLIALKKILSEV